MCKHIINPHIQEISFSFQLLVKIRIKISSLTKCRIDYKLLKQEDVLVM